MQQAAGPLLLAISKRNVICDRHQACVWKAGRAHLQATAKDRLFSRMTDTICRCLASGIRRRGVMSLDMAAKVCSPCKAARDCAIYAQACFRVRSDCQVACLMMTVCSRPIREPGNVSRSLSKVEVRLLKKVCTAAWAHRK